MQKISNGSIKEFITGETPEVAAFILSLLCHEKMIKVSDVFDTTTRDEISKKLNIIRDINPQVACIVMKELLSMIKK